jgi:hypothetical protein
MKYGSMGSALPGRFKCICGKQHDIESRVYIVLGKDQFPLGCRITEEKMNEFINNKALYKIVVEIPHRICGEV